MLSNVLNANAINSDDGSLLHTFHQVEAEYYSFTQKSLLFMQFFGMET